MPKIEWKQTKAAPKPAKVTPKLDIYGSMPKETVEENLEYRRVINKLAMRSWQNREILFGMFRKDILWAINTFFVIFEPRKEIYIPFLTWDFQDDGFLRMEKNCGKMDTVLEKSRDLGATWACLAFLFHQWRSRRKSIYGVASRKEDLVDASSKDPDTLFAKLDLIHEHLPPWLQVKKRHLHRVKLTMADSSTGSGMYGASFTGDLGRGGRKRMFFLDELAAARPADSFSAWASTQFVSDSRLAPSTVQGAVGAFYEIRHKPQQAIDLIRWHWSMHPTRKKGLYRGHRSNGLIEYLDKGYIHKPGYPFIADDKERSPYYDLECKRHPQPRKIAEELDINDTESGSPFFSGAIIDDHIEEFAMDHWSRVMLTATPGDHEPMIAPHQHGNLKLWTELRGDKPWDDHDYRIGCDISTGLGGDGSTASVASVMDTFTNEKVAELVVIDQVPHEFAMTVVALRKYFSGPSGPAFLIWEDNGPGQGFGKIMMTLMPERVYHRVPIDRRAKRKGEVPGWWSGQKEKRALLENYQAALFNKTFINRSAEALEECRHYIFSNTGTGQTIEHDKASADSTEASEAKENHGDRCIADALVCYGTISEITKKPTMEEPKPAKPPMYSMAWRMEQDKIRADEATIAWD
jgi:hypothetical protein